MTISPTILVVEDNPTTLKMLRLALEVEGYTVQEALDARSALGKVERALPDLVLQDLILPDLDGFELVRRLRAVAGGAGLPIIALSGFLGRLEDARAAEAGFSSLLVKPVEPSRLIEAVRAYLPQTIELPRQIGDGRRLMIVDDDPVQLKLSRLHLSQLGFEVETAPGGRKAIEALEAQPADAVLSDVFMPEMDGFQLAIELRRHPALGRIPVVLVSAQYGTEADRDLARRVGASALVLRTPDFANAVEALADALQRGEPAPVEEPGDRLTLEHARVVIRQLERQLAITSGLAKRCGFQAAQLSLLSGVADALRMNANIDVALRDVLGATLDAAGISKGALFLRDSSGIARLRHNIGFSIAEQAGLEEFFGFPSLLEALISDTAAVSVPSAAIAGEHARAILTGASVANAYIAPMVSEGRGVGAMLIGASRTDVTTEDAIAFARAMGNQVVQSLELAKSVAQLTASEQRHRTLLENATDAIAVLTAKGVIREVNRRWEEILGLPRERLVGRGIREFASPGLEKDSFETCRRAEAGESAFSGPVEIAMARGTSVLLELSSAAMVIDGEPLVLTIGRDVTEQRLLERQLRQSQKLEAIGQLAGGVAHDFNNVLTAILGFSERVLEELDPQDPLHADLMEIKKAGERAAGLTRQLLAFSRRQILQPKVLDPNALIGDIQAMLRRLIAEDIDLLVSLDPGVGSIKIDPHQLEQIIVNLAVNARDAMPRGGRLRIETGAAEPDARYQLGPPPISPGGYVVIRVSDTGGGMDESTMAHVFEPFFTTKRAGNGTGLGLSTVYGIVKQSGGEISVESTPGRGTTFTIHLPRVTEEVQISSPSPSAATKVAGGSETVLLVEDDEGVRQLARVTLRRYGYHVLEAENPRQALVSARAHAGPIHLLLSDVVMPESEGPPLIDLLRAERSGLLVLYMSGYADDALIARGILEGTPFLQKPFTPSELAQKVREVISSRSSEASG